MRYSIIGNGAAGIAAAESIRKNDPLASITIYSGEDYFHYSRPRLIDLLAGKVSIEGITIRKEEFYAKNNLRLVQPVRVTSIDPIQKMIRLEGGTEEGYDKCIIATGASSFLPPVPGADTQGVFTLRTIQDALRIIDYSQGKKDAVIIGGGLLGIEAGVSLTLRGLRVTIVEVFDRLLPKQLDAESARILQRSLETKNLSFLLPRQVQSISKQSDGRLQINFTSAEPIVADLALFSVGIRPNLSILEGSGIETGRGIRVNDFLQTSADSVYAAGDIAEHRGVIYGLWPAAREQGQIAGLNASGTRVEYTGSLLSATLKVAGINVASLGSIEPGEKVEELVKPGKETIRKFFIQEGKIVGAIFVGDISRFQEIQGMIKGGQKVSPSDLVP